MKEMEDMEEQKPGMVHLLFQRTADPSKDILTGTLQKILVQWSLYLVDSRLLRMTMAMMILFSNLSLVITMYSCLEQMHKSNDIELHNQY